VAAAKAKQKCRGNNEQMDTHHDESMIVVVHSPLGLVEEPSFKAVGREAMLVRIQRALKHVTRRNSLSVAGCRCTAIVSTLCCCIIRSIARAELLHGGLRAAQKRVSLERKRPALGVSVKHVQQIRALSILL